MFQRHPPSGRMQGGMKKLWFSTSISLFIANDTRYSYLQRQANSKSYMVYRKVPVLTTFNDCNPDFMVAPFFVTEYLRNGHGCYNKKLICRRETVQPPRVIEYFVKSLKVIRNDTVE